MNTVSERSALPAALPASTPDTSRGSASPWAARVRQRLSSYAAGVTAITAAGLAARLLFLGHQPLWRDEAFTAVVVRRPWGSMFDAVRADSAPPLAYVFDHVVAGISSSPAGLRLVSAIAGAGAIPLGAAIGRRIAGARCALVSAALCAVAPALLLSARDARMYALATTLVMASCLALWRAIESPSRRRYGLYALVTALALYTDYFAALAVAAQIIALVALRAGWRRVLTSLGAAALAGFLLLPWLVVARNQLGHAGSSFWVPQVGFTSVSGELIQFYSGPPLDPWVPAKALFQTFQGFAVTVGVVASIALVIWRRRLQPRRRRAATFFAICGIGAVLILLLISAWRPLVDGRYASVVWGVLFPLVAAGITLALRRWVLVTALAVMVAASTALSVAATHPDTPAAVTSIERHLGADDFVDAYPTQYLLFLYYGDARLLAHTHVVGTDVPWFWGTAAYPPGAIVRSIPSRVTANRGTIYYASEPGDPGFPSPKGYALRSTQCWTGVCVSAYRP